jgi:hypothetical protein
MRTFKLRNAAEPDGITSIQRFPTIFTKNLGAFKGHEHYLGRDTLHVYEMTLFSIGTMRLSALITSAVRLPRIRRKQNRDPTLKNTFKVLPFKQVQNTANLLPRTMKPYGGAYAGCQQLPRQERKLCLDWMV